MLLSMAASLRRPIHIRSTKKCLEVFVRPDKLLNDSYTLCSLVADSTACLEFLAARAKKQKVRLIVYSIGSQGSRACAKKYSRAMRGMAILRDWTVVRSHFPARLFGIENTLLCPGTSSAERLSLSNALRSSLRERSGLMRT